MNLDTLFNKKTENIPTTTKIGEEKVNLDPKLEKEADEIAEHIEEYVSEIVSENTKSNDVIQFDIPSDDELREIIKSEAEKQELDKIKVYASMSDIMAKVRDYYNSRKEYWKSWFTNPLTSYKELCVKWALESMEDTISRADGVEYQLYLALANDQDFGDNFENLDDYYDKVFREYDRITEIMDMLSTEKIFLENLYSYVTLHEVMQWMTLEQCSRVKDCILCLKNYCDAEGIKSVLLSANTNVIKGIVMLKKPSGVDANKNKLLIESFVKRLELMTSYIEKAANKKDSDEKAFKDRYWIRSTGSDPHYKGQHALFLVNKQNQKGCETDLRKRAGEVAKVYKPHDLSADNAVVGKKGVFNSINDLFKKEKTLKDTIIADEDAFATINIDVAHHVEECITKKESIYQE